ncbi:MAG: hypothetical protein JRN08_08860, partial [Nitrososphaerota archaeon]|nr:hypothetical protein [Nitrososphaerota archaeon]
HPDIPDLKNGRADFKVRDSVWIEVWGREDLASYQERMEEKRHFYDSKAYPLVEFRPDDFSPASKGALTRKIREIQDKATGKQTKLAPPETGHKPQRILDLATWEYGVTLALADEVVGPKLEELDQQIAAQSAQVGEAERRLHQENEKRKELRTRRDELIRPFRQS